MNKLLELGNVKKPKQKLQPIQAYSHLFWQSRLRQVVEPMWNAHLAANPDLTKRDRLAFQNRVLKEMMEKEPPSIRKEVEEYRHLHHVNLSEKDKAPVTVVVGNNTDLSLEEKECLRRKKAEEIQL